MRNSKVSGPSVASGLPLCIINLSGQNRLARSPMLVKISCPRCQGPLMLNEDHVGRLVRCPTCKNTFTATPPQPETVEPVEEALELLDAEVVPSAETNSPEREKEPEPTP